MFSRRCCVVLLGVVVVALVGCPSSGPNTSPVTGKVTIKGQPATGVRITFAPVEQANQTATGAVAADGTYSLFSGNEGKPGAMAGKYKVVLMGGAAPAEAMYQSGKAPPPVQEGPVPKEWASPLTTPKEVEVKAGPNTIDIDIP